MCAGRERSLVSLLPRADVFVCVHFAEEGWVLSSSWFVLVIFVLLYI